MSETPGIDWPQVLGDIAWLLGEPQPNAPHLRDPVGSQTLADRLRMSRGAVRNIRDYGREPSYSTGERILSVWAALAGKPAHYAPRERRSPGLNVPR